MSRAHRHLDRRRWQAVRILVFERDGYRCTGCGLPGALEADHVVPLERGRCRVRPGQHRDLVSPVSLCKDGVRIRAGAARRVRSLA